MSDVQQQGLLLTRTFNARRELIFKVWTEPEHFEKWWGPKGYSLEITEMDVRPDGMFFGCQKSPDGNNVMWGKFVYQEVTKPEKLVFIQSFSDELGNTIRAPFNPDWPLEIINILTLEEKEGNTTLTLEGGPYKASDIEQGAYNGMAPMVKQGMEGTLDQLADYLASQKTM